ncbi:hypothetical protein [Streptomyces sp. NPDC002490]|uniref:hypothetical protein n=1 Tax=Streptomyces sp. NPDC002490 TaxID=3154416 RepID=UPI00331FE123
MSATRRPTTSATTVPMSVLLAAGAAARAVSTPPVEPAPRGTRTPPAPRDERPRAA